MDGKDICLDEADDCPSASSCGFQERSTPPVSTTQTKMKSTTQPMTRNQNAGGCGVWGKDLRIHQKVQFHLNS